jgi:periplasmic protein TonB
MLNPLSGRSFSLLYSSVQRNWLQRIRENTRAALTVSRGLASSANGAPIHLLEGHRQRTSRQGIAQAGSAFVHGAICLALLYAVSHIAKKPIGPSLSGAEPLNPLTFEPPEFESRSNRPSQGLHGGGGHSNLLPPTAGALAPHARYELAPPRLPDHQQHLLSVPVTIFDPQAPQFPPAVKELGLPWLKEMTNSAGPGNNGIGNRKGPGMGDVGGPGAGRGNDQWPYNGVSAPVTCKYCPDPTYSDEARKAKLQGLVTLRVFVGEDGRAKDIQVVQGLGLGLNERAVEAVRKWQFFPARDGAGHPVACWVLIETTYRLF